ncbi:MAG: hypothetical protein PHP57_13175 [Sideroxydans sp.]|nr:hypothetical protein [Sideroxydans sp.]
MLAHLPLFPSLPASLVATHLLVLLPKSKALPKDILYGDLLVAMLKRRDMKVDAFAKAFVTANTTNGGLVSWAMLDFEIEPFALQRQVRKAMQLLLDEQTSTLSIVVSGPNAQRAAVLAVYGAWVNGALLPVNKKKDERKVLEKINLYGIGAVVGRVSTRQVGLKSDLHKNVSEEVFATLEAYVQHAHRHEWLGGGYGSDGFWCGLGAENAARSLGCGVKAFPSFYSLLLVWAVCYYQIAV